MKLLDYDMGQDVRAFSTLRGEVRPDSPYSSFNITDYCGDDAAHVAACRRMLCEELDISDDQLLLPHQIHSDHIVTVDAAFMAQFPRFDQSVLPDADALVTNLPGICIGVSTADCIPVLLYEPCRRVIAAVHAGWRGAAKRIVAKTVEVMRGLGCDAAQLQAVIGPGIALDSFEVGEEVVDVFRSHGFPQGIVSRSWPKPHIDLAAACAFQMEEAGVGLEHISVAGVDTYTDCQNFFSARRLGIRSGRIYTGIIMKE